MSEKKQKTIKVLYVPVEGNIEEREIGKDDLAAAQALVGGYIEPVPFLDPAGKRALMYVNEEGLLRGLKFNVRLSLLARKELVGNGYIENPSKELIDVIGKHAGPEEKRA